MKEVILLLALFALCRPALALDASEKMAKDIVSSFMTSTPGNSAKWSENRNDQLGNQSVTARLFDSRGKHVASVVWNSIMKASPNDTFPEPSKLLLSINCENERRLRKKCLSPEDPLGQRLVVTAFSTLGVTEPPADSLLRKLKPCFGSGKDCSAADIPLRTSAGPAYMMDLSVSTARGVPQEVSFSFCDYQTRTKYNQALKDVFKKK